MRFIACLLWLVLGGCASESVSIRNLPTEHPAAENAAAAESAAAFTAAAMGAADSDPDQASPSAEPSALPVTPSDAPSMYTYDPWERLNRFTYRFNARFDERIFLPVSNVYRHVPAPIRSGVHNFFGNLSEVDSVVNYTLQWRLKLGLRSAGRFVINSTIGIGGLFDVAAKLKLRRAPTGVSTTLAKWGMHPGPFLVLPLLGPSTLRDGLGFVGDYGLLYGVDLGNLYRGNVSLGLGMVNAVDQRSNVSFRYYATGSPFEYENIRFLYVRKRLIEDQRVRVKEISDGEKSTTQEQNEVAAPAGK